MNYREENAKTIDRWVDEGWIWGQPISHEDYLRAKNGEWDMLLTPTVPVPRNWFGELKGKRVLALASGGGQQGPVFAALGADVTVLDLSDRQLESERIVAEREGYTIRTVKADMTEPLPFPDGAFDLVFHPVADCYIREIAPLYKEVSRVLVPGGVFLGGFDNGINFLVNDYETQIVNRMPFDPLTDEEQRKQLEADDCGVQFSHFFGETLKAILEAGFAIRDIYDDTNGEGRLHELNVPTFFSLKAIKEAQ